MIPNTDKCQLNHSITFTKTHVNAGPFRCDFEKKLYNEDKWVSWTILNERYWKTKRWTVVIKTNSGFQQKKINVYEWVFMFMVACIITRNKLYKKRNIGIRDAKPLAYANNSLSRIFVDRKNQVKRNIFLTMSFLQLLFSQRLSYNIFLTMSFSTSFSQSLSHNIFLTTSFSKRLSHNVFLTASLFHCCP